MELFSVFGFLSSFGFLEGDIYLILLIFSLEIRGNIRGGISFWAILRDLLPAALSFGTELIAFAEEKSTLSNANSSCNEYFSLGQ